VGAVGAFVAVCAWAAWACLPDLEIAPPSQPSFCGDGVINPDAGEECDPGPDASAAALLACPLTPAPGCQVGNCPSDGGTFAFSDPASHHCYFSMNDTTDITTAAAICVANLAHVVRFVSAREVELVAPRAPTSPFWVGLRETALDSGSWVAPEPTDEPGWSQGCGGCFAQVNGGTIAPSTGPDPLANIGECVVAANDTSTLWTQSPCKAVSHETMCEREPVGTRTTPCAYGACFTVAATVTSKRYVLYGSREPASGAISVCQTLGGQLAAFDSPEEREQVGYEIGRQTVIDGGSMGVGDYWIGLGSDAGVWTWDGPQAGTLSPLPWAVGQPSASDAGLRAYVTVQSETLNSELATVDTQGASHYPLCQY
jgi:hypothetical protein